MSWNYRVVRLTEPDGRPYYEIREAYYPDLKSERPWTITANAVRPGGSTLLELRKDLALMLAAFDKAPLNDADFPDHAEPLSSAALAGSAPQGQTEEKNEERDHTRVDGVPEGEHGDLPRPATE